MEHLHPWDRRVQAEGLRSCPLEDVARALGYRRDPDDDARWRRLGSVVSINRFMFYDHLRGEGGAGAVDLVVHAQRCSVPDALAFLAELPGHSRRPPECLCPWLPHPQERHWPAVERYLVEQRGLSPVLLALCRDLGLVHADRHGNAVFVCRDAAGSATGAEIVPAGARCTAATGAGDAAPPPLARGGFWISWELDWPHSVAHRKERHRRPVRPLPQSRAGRAQGMRRGLDRRRHANPPRLDRGLEPPPYLLCLRRYPRRR